MRASILTTILFAPACWSAHEPTTTTTPPTAPLRGSMTEVNAKAHVAANPTGPDVTVSTCSSAS